MIDQINWTPFVVTAWILVAFFLLCGIAVAGDLWAKGSRRCKPVRKPVEWLNGEKVYLN